MEYISSVRATGETFERGEAIRTLVQLEKSTSRDQEPELRRSLAPLFQGRRDALPSAGSAGTTTPLVGYLVALALTLACTLVASWLQAIVRGAHEELYRPYTILYLCVLAPVVYRFGIGPGLAVFAAALAATYLFLTPTAQDGVLALGDLRLRDGIEILGMCLAGSLVIWGANRHRSQQEKLSRALTRVEVLHAAQEHLLADVLRSATQGKLLLYPPGALFPTLSRVLMTVPLTEPQDLALLRDAVRTSGASTSIANERLGLFLMAAHEAAMNAIVHGGSGIAVVGFQGDADKSSFAVAITDNGPGIALDKLPERTLHGGISGANSLGMGFSLALDGADRIHLRTSPRGTDMLLEVDRVPPAPAWFERLVRG